jgi:hypothetical protein
MFFASTRMVVGDGNTSRFWTDRWIDGKAIMEIAPAVFNLVSKRLSKSMTGAGQQQLVPSAAWKTPRRRTAPVSADLADDIAFSPKHRT